jgi:hypothetical protein
VAAAVMFLIAREITQPLREIACSPTGWPPATSPARRRSARRTRSATSPPRSTGWPTSCPRASTSCAPSGRSSRR